MSVLSNEGSVFVPLAVLAASLLGSGHCVAMCGGLVVSIARTRGGVLRYHLGRLGGYMLLGALAGGVGSGLLDSTGSRLGGRELLGWIAAGLLGLGFIGMGTRLWKGGGVHFQILPEGVLRRVFSWAPGRPMLAGSLSAFLPCGWLQGFVLAAIASGGMATGAALLFFFWLGTLPALTAAPVLFQRLFRPWSARLPRLSGAILIGVGIFCVSVKLFSAHPVKPVAVGDPQQLQCHPPGN